MSTQATKALTYLMALAAASLLAACGGGGSSGGDAAQREHPGTLDPSFGDAGAVINSKASSAGGIALQPDGKVVVAAGEWLIRYDRSGVPDATFGTGGFASAAPSADGFVVRRVSLQPYGKIVAAGSFVRAGPSGDFHCALTRYAIDGAIDRTFGDRGLVVGDPEGDVSTCTDIATQRDGSILVGVHFGIYAISVGVVARFHIDGALDTTFGANGVASGDGAIAIQPDGKIIAASIRYGHGSDQCTVARLDAGGAKDTAFADGGYVAWKGPFDESAPLSCALALQPDGRFVVLNQGRVARFLENGAPDSGFGGGVTTGVPGVALAVQSNGKFVIAGRDEMGRFALWRLGANGQLDSGFGNDGIVVTPLLGAGGVEGLAIQPDGRIVASGWTEAPGETPVVPQSVLIRYFGD